MFVAPYFANLFGSFVNHWTLGCIWSQGRMVTFWGPTKCSYWPCIDQWEGFKLVMRFCIDCTKQHCFAQVFMGSELSFCDSLIRRWLPWPWWALAWYWPGEPGGGRQTSGSITGQYSVLFRLLQNYECKWGILDSREGGRTQIGCDAPFWVDWINNWWLHIYSHGVIRTLSSFCDKSWLFESNIKLNGDLLVSKLRPDLVVILTVISFIPLSQILMHIQVSS